MAFDVILAAVGGAAAGLGTSAAFYLLRERAVRAERLAQEQTLKEQLRRDSESAALAARLATQEQLNQGRAELEKSFANQRQAIAAEEQRLSEREAVVNRQLDRFAQMEGELRQRGEALETTRGTLDVERQNL
ncbi:MAG TPA: Rnase Y domain-containing protein, partial [Verrucomicrobiota bacterium]|nr:Rnase Y domain-containing protein [Verrucomicrobiota bacterium]